MSRIVTLTMNPALDLSTTVGAVVPFIKLRCTPVRRDPGGGGINVARVTCRLGASATAVYPAGGMAGETLRKLVATECVESVIVPIAGDTREDFSVFETETRRQFRFVAPGPELSPGECDACLDAFSSSSHAAQFAVISGSLPPALNASFFAKAAHVAGAKLVLDTTGEGLKAAMGERVALVKPNQHEFAEFAGVKSVDPKALADAARNIVAQGHIGAVALTLAGEGAILVTRDEMFRAFAPKIEAVSTVGAGDSFLGAMVWSLMEGRTWREALSFAVAAGSAALLSEGTDLAHPDVIHRLLPRVETKEIG